ncbi:MAG: glycosyltransferase family 9 protein [Planctomycetota bacterium]
MRILMVRLSALGDVVMGLHVLSTLRARVGSAYVAWLVEDRFAGLLEGHPQLDALHIYGRKTIRTPSGFGVFRQMVRTLRDERFDVVLDLQGNLKSGVLTRLTGAERRVGLAAPLGREGNPFFMTESVPVPPGHRFDSYRGLLDHVFGPGEDAPAVLPGHGERHDAIVLHPGVSRFGAFKRWPADHYADLGSRLAAKLDRPVLLTAGPGERDQAEAVASAMDAPAEIREPANLRALVDTLAGAHLVVAADTGPAHIASATGVPTLTLFGPKDPDVLAPLGPRARSTRAGVRCSPCPLRACPDPICMTELSVDQVERDALALLTG